MTLPRWTYTEANASRWKPLFDLLIGGQTSVEIPLVDNAKTLASLKIRVGDALKWLADHYKRDKDETFKPYAELKRKLRFGIKDDSLTLRLRRSPTYEVPVVTTETATPLNFTVDSIKRMISMMREEQRPLASRKKFAATLLQELSLRKGDAMLSSAGLCLEQIVIEMTDILTQKD